MLCVLWFPEFKTWLQFLELIYWNFILLVKEGFPKENKYTILEFDDSEKNNSSLELKSKPRSLQSQILYIKE